MSPLSAPSVEDRRGNVAVMTAIALPAIAMLAAGAVEIAAVTGDRAKLQAAADAAALAGARELALSSDAGVAERAKASALQRVQTIVDRGAVVTPEAEIVDDGGALRVALHSKRPSFFGDLLPPGGFQVRVEAVAANMGRIPLCVLVHGEGVAKGEAALLKDSADISAPGCLVHSNSDIVVENSARLTAGVVQSVKSAKGAITPAAEVGAEPIEDPFNKKDVSMKGSCLAGGKPIKFEDVAGAPERSLPPGRYCDDVEVKKWTRLKLQAGEYYFDKVFKIDDDASLSGADVALVFGKDAKFEFNGRSKISLEGRKAGGFAGFLIVTQRTGKPTDSPKDFIIMSDHVSKLLGTIYIPDHRLVVDGKEEVAEQSDWTVVVARSVQLKNNPTLVINKNYAGSDVPVPAGVGPTRSNVRLDR
jgi:hypothetical protein